MNHGWLLLIVPASFYAGFVYSNWRWRELIRAVSEHKPEPSPYR